MLSRAEWAGSIPHQGAMVLLDDVRAWDDRHLDARSTSHRDRNHPLRRADGRLHAVVLCEVAAQAMALHGALAARDEGRVEPPGWLVSLRDVTLAREFIDDVEGAMRVHVERLLATPGAWQYAFRIEHRGENLASGRAAVMLR